MKKRAKIILGLFFLCVIIFILWPRTLKRMETIARNELRDNVHETIIHKLKGPLIYDEEDYTEFVWYKKLEWGDTSKIFIRVCRSFFLCDRYDSWWRNFFCYLEPQVTMNYQWYYFIFSDGTSNFEEVFPMGAKGIQVMSSVEMETDIIKVDGFMLTVPADHLIYFLKKGYFEVLQKEQETTTIAFYEPIAEIYLQDKRDTVKVMTAKVLSNDTTGITVAPYETPKEAWKIPVQKSVSEIKKVTNKSTSF